MLIDTHCHLYLTDQESDINSIVQRAAEAGVTRMVCPAIDLNSALQAIQLSKQFDQVVAAVGIHPNYTSQVDDDYLTKLTSIIAQEDIVAVGEIGLDYYRDYATPEQQKASFIDQIRLAIESDLPVIVHNREADEDTIDLLTNTGCSRGVAHCFSSDYLTAKAFLELGFYISFAGNITFKNTHLREVAKAIPLDRTLVETDAPFLSPVPFRGKQNEPARCRLVAQQLAAVHSMPVEDVAQITSTNAKRLFSLS